MPPQIGPEGFDPAAEGRRAGRALWPAGASWVPEAVLARLEELAARHPHPPGDADAARTAFLNAARNARTSAPTRAEAVGRDELLARLRAANAARTAAARAAAGKPAEGDPELAAIVRRRRASLERRRAARADEERD
jgi:hypothetical protein